MQRDREQLSPLIRSDQCENSEGICVLSRLQPNPADLCAWCVRDEKRDAARQSGADQRYSITYSASERYPQSPEKSSFIGPTVSRLDPTGDRDTIECSMDHFTQELDLADTYLEELF